MDGGEIELSDYGLLQNSNSTSSNTQVSTSMDSFLDEFLKNTKTCTHTHTCNPPGPDAAHTHTCYHTHTQVFQSEEDDGTNDREPVVSKPRRASGNKEAVRKYREKKKAHTAFLEEEVKKLRVLNQHLVRKLQGQSMLEAEVLRLRGLLMDLRGKIDNELGVLSFQKQCNNTTTSFKEGDCGILQSNGTANGAGMGRQRCEKDTLCFHPQMGTSIEAIGGGGKMVVASWREGNCRPTIIDCRANANDIASAEGYSFDAVEALVSSASQAD
ncbi:basic leucine zipper 24-like [Cornus florida]|uniref:basic leucine zipper 24-like n=1 Tax=Cornus florida TaxID=4283 RepID=UPI0028985194|nr:basic leucine zipper 24-like [Cornus florida]